MKRTDVARAVTWLVRDTFRQSIASGIGWLLFGLSTVCILVCLSIKISAPKMLGPAGEHADYLPRFDSDAKDEHKLHQSGVTVADGTMSIGFGAMRVPVARDTQGAVHFIQLILAGGVADTLGLLLTLIWTAGFLPGFLDRRAVSVILAKPISRWWLMLGKYVGVLSFVLAQAVYFVGGTWLALALRTGVWDGRYLLSIPLLLLHFAIFFSFSLLLAVCTRNTVVCVFGSIAFWGVCWAMNFARHAVVAAAAVAPQGSFSRGLVWFSNAGYWLFPKPVDLGRIVFDALGAETCFRPILDSAVVTSMWLSVLTSLAFTLYILAAAGRQFVRMDY